MKRVWIIAVVTLLVITAGCSLKEPVETVDSEQNISQQTVSDSFSEEGADDSNTEADASDIKTEEHAAGLTETEEMVVKITIGDRTITATLYDNEAARALWDMLPQTFPIMNLYGREMCYRMGNGALPDSTAQDIGYEIGIFPTGRPPEALSFCISKTGRFSNR